MACRFVHFVRMMYFCGMKRACLLGLAVVVVGAEAMMPLTQPFAACSDGPDSLKRDTAFVDTLHELTVMGDSLRLAPVRDAIEQSLKRNVQPHVPSLGEVLNKVAPNTMDYILHPFGFAERKRQKRLKKMKSIMQEYDRVEGADAFTLKLDSIMRLEGLK